MGIDLQTGGGSDPLRGGFLVELDRARVLFTTRLGGVSEEPYESLNLGLLTGDQGESVLENRRRVATAAGLERVATGHQVHGVEIREWADEPDASFLDPHGAREEVDGHATTQPGLGLLVLVADCYPVALAGGGRVAMLHCGWRGLAAGILERAAATFAEPPAAAVGPGIGGCCYEVGHEVLVAFEDVEGAADGRMLDLRRVADARLRAAGVRSIQHVNECTSCQPELFFSHRRDHGVTGRQGGLAWLDG